MYDDILVPTDGSPGAEVAIDHALHVARQNDATLHPLYVVDVSDMGDIGDDPDELRAEGRDVIEPVVDAAEDAGLEVSEHVAEGTPYERIVECAEAHEIDLVVMGTHGKSGLSRALLGSTAEKVVRHSAAPVLTVRNGPE